MFLLGIAVGCSNPDQQIEAIGNKMAEAQQLQKQTEAKVDRAYGLIQLLYQRSRSEENQAKVDYLSWVDSLEMAVDSTVLWAGRLRMPNMRGIPEDKVNEHLDQAEGYLDTVLVSGNRHHSNLDRNIEHVKDLLK